MSRYQELIAERRKKIEAANTFHEKNAARFAPLVDKCFALGGDASVSENEWLDLSLSGDKHKLTEMIRALRTAGFNCDTRPEEGKPSFYGHYYASDPVTHACTSVFLNFTSTVCRRVKVGTKVVPEHTEDVYETVCGEADGNLEPVAQAATADDSIPF